MHCYNIHKQYGFIMMKHIFLLLCLATITIAYAKPVFALETLIYDKKISTSLSYQIDIFLKEQFDTSLSQYSIASIDLNNDGVDENVIKQNRCVSSGGKCTYLIIAEKKHEIFILFKIRAYNLAVGDANSSGVKDVLALTDKTNDYNFDIYMWSPSRKMYILRTD